MTSFHLIRHGAHDLLGRVLVGRGPVSISAQGRDEAAAMAETMPATGLAAILSSPQQRSIQTAEFLAQRNGLPVTLEPALDELDMGRWTGATFETLREDATWHDFNLFRGLAPVPDGETMLAAQARAVALLLRLRAAWPDQAVALVSHADIIKAILAFCLGMPLDLMGRLDIAPASRSVVELHGRDLIVRSINLPPMKLS